MAASAVPREVERMARPFCSSSLSAFCRAIAALGVSLSLIACGPDDTGESDQFSVVEEEVTDKPFKSQILQHVIALSDPTKEQLQKELSRRYSALKARRGFTYQSAPNAVYIYVYRNEQQARAGRALWLGMLLKGSSDVEPTVVINEERVEALKVIPQERFGLSETQRTQLYSEMGLAEDRAMREAMTPVPDTEILKLGTLYRTLKEKYKEELFLKYKITGDEWDDIFIEGYKKGWL